MRHNMEQFDSKLVFLNSERLNGSDLFQRYGICGTCELISHRGLVAVSALRLKDKVIARNGFAAALAVVRQKGAESSTSGKKIAILEKGSLGGKIPQQKTVLGGGVVARRYLQSGSKFGSKFIGLQAGDSAFDNHLQDCKNEELFMVVFQKRTEVQIHGIYVTCPGISDIKDWLQDGVAQTVRHS